MRGCYRAERGITVINRTVCDGGTLALAPEPGEAAMKITELMTPDPITVRADEPIIGAIAAVTAAEIRHLPVVDAEDQVVGMMSERDIIAAMDPEGRLFDDDATVADIVGGPVLSLSPSTTVVEAIDLFIDERIGAAPVLDEGKLVGIVSVIDVLRAARARFT